MWEFFTSVLSAVFVEYIVYWLPFVVGPIVAYLIKGKSRVEAVFYGLGAAAFATIIATGMLVVNRTGQLDFRIAKLDNIAAAKWPSLLALCVLAAIAVVAIVAALAVLV